jgi:hypothetical protein
LKRIVFSSHAENKFDILKGHGFDVSKNTIISTLERPDKLESGYRGRRIAQKILDERHIIRVIFEDLPTILRVLTFYPGRRERYED